jgi:myo-inositol-hexaphosphate 3-phosphohydrolase
MVYDRETYAFLGRFTIAGGDGIDDVEQTSGIGVTSAPLGEAYPTGALIIHDADNDGGENLKYVPWRTVTRRLGLM